MISADVRNCISLVGQSLVVFDVVFLVVGLPSIVFARLAFIASLVALPFTMFATRVLDNVFVRVCGVSLLELWSFLSRALWFFTCMVVLYVRA
ncbi:hypothetical protein F2Q70_00002812 [Brassica cretica]|uniref:Uncharacterized protein n=1 Tax=Brassica cretica TaxID=69181 RepID=A0A8S9IWS8_BRACR|nr:hypothetical protein F2Q70_00002812 [Brassica cretica]